MDMEHQTALTALLKAIEEKLQWGAATGWSSYDFDTLAGQILERTKTNISSNTLKRVWGRIKYDSSPSDVTLNTLAKFLGHTDYRAFKMTLTHPKASNKKGPKKRTGFKWPPFKSRPSMIFASGAIFMLIALIAISYSSKEAKLNPDDFYFTSRKVTKGLPNSVVFAYRAASAPKNAKVEIQQSWDRTKRQTVKKNDSVATSIYYDPGYFKAKLVVQDQVVKEHGVLITSDGWWGKIQTPEKTVYLNDSSITKPGIVALTDSLLLQNGIPSKNEMQRTAFRYVDSFGDLRVNDLVVETQFRNTATTNLEVCQMSSVTLIMEGEAIIIPFSRMGCISDLQLYHLNKGISGKSNDLSKFGVDFGDWVTLRCIFKNDTLTIMINGQQAISLPMGGRINKMHGLIYRFEGTGTIRSLSLKNEEKAYFDWPLVK